MQVDKKLLIELRNATFAGFIDCKEALLATNNNFDEAVKWLKEKGKIKAAKKQGAIAAEGVAQYYAENEQAGAIIEVNSQTDFVAKNAAFTEVVNKVLNRILEVKPKTALEIDSMHYDQSEQTIADKLIELTSKIGEKITIRRFEIYEAAENEFVYGYTHANKKYAAMALFKGQKVEDPILKNILMNIVSNNPIAIDKNHLDPKWVQNEYETLLKKTIEEGKPANMAANIAKGRLNKQLEETCLLNETLIAIPDKKVDAYLKENGIEILKFVRYEVGEGLAKNQCNFVDEVNAQMKK